MCVCQGEREKRFQRKKNATLPLLAEPWSVTPPRRRSRPQVGDGTTTVVILAAELLKCADRLVKEKIHPTSIISGFRLASKEAVKFIQVCLQRALCPGRRARLLPTCATCRRR